jgi:hypothetical protein
MASHFTKITWALTLLAACGVAQAQSVGANFNVKVTLTAKCEATNSGAAEIQFGTYIAFQTAAKTAIAVTNAPTFRCTRNLAITNAAFTGGLTGVIPDANLQYTLSAPTGTKTTTGTGANTVQIGTPDIWTYNFTGSMPAGQAGNVLGNAAEKVDLRELVITF